MVRQDKRVTSPATEVAVAPRQVVKYAPFAVLRGSQAESAHIACRPTCRRLYRRAAVALHSEARFPRSSRAAARASRLQANRAVVPRRDGTEAREKHGERLLNAGSVTVA